VVKSIHSEVGDNWFVSFESEADAIATMKDIQASKITFNGQPFKGRLKAAVSPRSQTNGAPSPRVQQPPIQGYAFL
jgi:hypothetical protein